MWVSITTAGGCLALPPVLCEGIGGERARSARGRGADLEDCDAELLGLFYCDADGREYLPFSMTQISGPHP